MFNTEKRSAVRLALNVPTLIEIIGQPSIELHENLRAVYERVNPSTDEIGHKLPGIMRDLSTNGAFIAGDPLPLLARVSFSFELPDFGQVAVFGWTLWRRSADCEIPRESGSPVILPKGFGVLFEAIPLDARVHIHKLVTATHA